MELVFLGAVRFVAQLSGDLMISNREPDEGTIFLWSTGILQVLVYMGRLVA